VLNFISKLSCVKRLLVAKIGFGEPLHSLNEYELIICSLLVNPSEIDITFNEIAGIDNVIDMIIF
jgi:hypothetical protein